MYDILYNVVRGMGARLMSTGYGHPSLFSKKKHLSSVSTHPTMYKVSVSAKVAAICGIGSIGGYQNISIDISRNFAIGGALLFILFIKGSQN